MLGTVQRRVLELLSARGGGALPAFRWREIQRLEERGLIALAWSNGQYEDWRITDAGRDALADERRDEGEGGPTPPP